MSDLIDLANDHADYLLQVSIAQHQRRTAGHAASAEWCESCGVDIPEARRAAVPGCQTCIDCQQLRERRV
jgi:phage/conjugal plasmid C-4 type zinc finger TraR family protein